MKIVKLTQCNFTRREDMDFNDDGNKFKGYQYKGIPATYTKWQDMTFIAFRYDYGNSEIYEKFCNLTDEEKQEVRDLFNEFNGVETESISKEEIIDWAEQCYKLAIAKQLIEK